MEIILSYVLVRFNVLSFLFKIEYCEAPSDSLRD